jgi:hypothetical protein
MALPPAGATSIDCALLDWLVIVIATGPGVTELGETEIRWSLM